MRSPFAIIQSNKRGTQKVEELERVMEALRGLRAPISLDEYDLQDLLTRLLPGLMR